MAGVPIAFRCGTEQEWNTHDPVLLAGELGLVLSSDPDTQLMKIGNGVNTWSALPWAARGPRGFDFEYSWDGTSLGVKHSDEASFTYVDLGMYFAWNGTKLGVKRGEDEAFTEQQLSLDFNWDGTQLGVKNPAATNFAYTGLGLQFNWDGHALGVKREEDAEFTYQYLRGASLEYDWDGTSLGIKTSEEDAFQYTELKGEKGETGDPGDLSKDKIWVGNSENVAEEQPLPDTSVEKIKGINEYVRRYVVFYSQYIFDTQSPVSVSWHNITQKPVAYTPKPHNHDNHHSIVGHAHDYKSDITNKPSYAPLLHYHIRLSRNQRRQAIRHSYMYGG